MSQLLWPEASHLHVVASAKKESMDNLCRLVESP